MRDNILCFANFSNLYQTGDQLENIQAHEFDHQINDIQFSPDRTHFITASKDKSAKVSPNLVSGMITS